MKRPKAEQQPLPEPPEHLSDSAKSLYRASVPARARSIERITLLVSGLEARDRAEGARLAVLDEGMTSTTESTKAVEGSS